MFTSSHTRKRSAGGSGGNGGSIIPYKNELAFQLSANNFVGTDNNIVLDSSDNAYPVTRVGNISQGRYSAFSPNGYSVDFDGTNDYITAPNSDAFKFGTGEFTVEFWMRPTNWGANGQGIAGQKLNDASTGWVIYNNGASTKLHTRIGGASTTADFVSVSDVDKGKWQHWALVRGNGTLRWYKNGILDNSSSAAIHLGNITDATGLFTIGHTQTWTGNLKFRGAISNLHVVKKALYTDNFTPPAPITESVTETTFLGLNESYLKDASTFNHVLTPVGYPDCTNYSPNATAVYDQEIHSGGYNFPGSGCSMVLPGDSLKDISNVASSCTIEGFFKVHVTGPTYQMLFYINRSPADTYAEYSLSIDTPGGLTLRVADSTRNWQLLQIPFPRINQYVHIAVVRSGTNFRVYVAGILRGTLSVPSFTPVTGQVLTSTIGSNNAATFPLRGDMSSFRIVNGQEVYTTNFTPPKQALAKIPGTKLLLLGTNANVIDSVNRSNIVTLGNARIEQTIVKEGLGSLYFDGTGDYFKVSPSGIINNSANRNSAVLISASDYRLSGWAYIPGIHVATKRTLVSTKVNTNEAAGTTSIFVETGILKVSVNGAIQSTNLVIPADNWFHWALVRIANSLAVYINGAFYGVVSAAATIEASTYLTIGANDNGSDPFLGYMDNIELEIGKSSIVNTFLAPVGVLSEKTEEADTDYKYNILQMAVNGVVGDKTLLNKTIASKVDYYSKEAATLQGASDYLQTSNYGPFSRVKSALFCADTIGGASFTGNSITDLFFGKKVTIEAWIFPMGFHISSGTFTGIIFSNRDATTNAGQLEFGYYGRNQSDSYQLGLFSGRNSTVVKSTILGKLREWAHVVVEIDLRVPGTANEVVFIINGVREVTTHNFSTLVTGTATHNFSIGKSSANVTTPVVGYIRELRLVADSEYVYDANMVVPNSELTNVPGTMLRIDNKRNNARNEVSPNRFKLSGALKYNFGKEDINSAVDLGPNYNSAFFSAAYNAANDTQRNYAFAAVTKDSGYYDIGTGDITIECYYEPVGTFNRILNILDAGFDSIVRIGGNASAQYSYQFGTSSLNVGATTNSNCSIVAGELVHLAIVRKNGVVKFSIDGVVYDTKANTDNIRISKLRLGGNDAVANSYSNGMFGIAQISLGAKYDGNFVTDTSVHSNDANTLFTMKFKNPMVFDTTGNCKLLAGSIGSVATGIITDINLTGVNNVDGKRSIQTYVNNSNEMTIKRPINIYRNDIVFEFSLNGAQPFNIDTGGATAGFFALAYNGTNVLLYLRNNGSSTWNLVNGTAIHGTLSATDITHICVRKIGDIVTVFINGVVKHTRATATTWAPYISEIYISCDVIREIRVTEGVKRYVDNVIDV